MTGSRFFMTCLCGIPASLVIALASLAAIATRHPAFILPLAIAAAVAVAPALLMIALVTVLRIHDVLGTWGIVLSIVAMSIGCMVFGPAFLNTFGLVPFYLLFDSLRESERRQPIL